MMVEEMRRQFNAMFNGRKNRRAAYRKWLKAHRVPKPVFPKISQRLSFNHLNAATFIEDIMNEIKWRESLKTSAAPEGAPA